MITDTPSDRWGDYRRFDSITVFWLLFSEVVDSLQLIQNLMETPEPSLSFSLKLKMQFLQLPTKIQALSRLTNLVLVSFSFCIIYLLVLLCLIRSSNLVSSIRPLSHDVRTPTTLEHIVFGIASNKNSWPNRKEYVKIWWKPLQMRGCVFLESMPPDADSYNDSTSLPPVCVSEDTSRFRYTFRNGLRSAIRVARVVSETVALNHSDVRWFVFGDDDTIFFPETLAKTLSKYDHDLWYYIGANSEIYEQNRLFSLGMAFGGAGFAISYPLAKVLAKVFDSCIERYPHLYGSDSRIYSCVAELGVELTREPGFHQFDLRGDVSGLLAAHPVAPLVSLHHLDHIDPIFPNMTANKALQHLFKAVTVDPERILQHTVCYDRWFFWTISVSWGYSVQVFQHHIPLADVLPMQQTFRQWKMGGFLNGVYSFNTRELHPDPCQRPTVFFFDNVSSSSDQIKSSYTRNVSQDCLFDNASPKKLQEVKVFSKKLDLNIRQLQAPRRHCCDVLPPSAGKVMEIAMRECKEEELIYMHP